MGVQVNNSDANIPAWWSWMSLKHPVVLASKEVLIKKLKNEKEDSVGSMLKEHKKQLKEHQLAKGGTIWETR